MGLGPVTERFGRLFRRAALPAAWLAGAVVFLLQVHRHYRIGDWLFWSYATYWVLGALLTLACWCAGDAITRRLLPGLPASERIVCALTTGLLAFFLAMFLGGLAGLYGRAFFVLLPLVMIASAGMPFVRFVRRLSRHVRGAWTRWPPGPLALAAAAFGLGGLAMVYFPILSPENVAYDARWYHVAIAEHYAAAGAVRPFVEGWTLGTLPHLASFLYTWAFLLPGSDLFDRVELSAHLEFFVVCWTLVTIPVLVRACTRRALRDTRRERRRLSLRPEKSTRPPSSGLSSWAALFLFPGIFLYDSALGAAADHVGAFWAVPVLLATFRFHRAPGARTGAFLAVALSGGLLTKYQGIYFAVFPVASLLVRSLWLLATGFGEKRAERNAVLGGAFTTLGAGLLLTAPHWLKNWLWYGDPIYPNLYRYLPLHPWTVDSGVRYSSGGMVGGWAPTGTTSHKLLETLEAVVTFSFRPHDWPTFHGQVPVFGSLFTLSVLPLVFLRGTRRLWAVTLAAHLGVFVWYWTFYQDRYLQALVPWMASVVAGTFVLTWTAGVVPRIAVCLLFGLQVVWGGDVFFFPTHSMTHAVGAKAAMDLMATGFRKKIGERRQIYGVFGSVGRTLPRGAKVLVHDSHTHLGVNAMSVSDWGSWQGGLSYGRFDSPRALYDRLKEWNVTHLLWSGSREEDALAGDLVFFSFADTYGSRPRPIEGWKLARLPSDPPPATDWANAQVAVFVCSEDYEPGMYRLRDLNVPKLGRAVFPPPLRRADTPEAARGILADSQFAASDASCGPRVDVAALGLFKKVGTRGSTGLWMKTTFR